MTGKQYKQYLFLFLTWASFFTARSQSVTCPPNIDFELGNFSGWECKAGYVVVDIGGANITQLLTTGQMAGRHTMIPSTNTEVDPYGLFPKKCPNGSGYSIQLGNDIAGSESEGISFKYSIPANATKFSLIYHYAIVLQNPGHTAQEQPRFRAKIFDLSTNQEINCVSFDFTASSQLPGFLESPVSNVVVYKGWTPITVDLSAYAGKDIRLDFITSDCTRNGHFGYAYVDVGSSCNGAIDGAYLCDGDNFVNLNAPNGFASYSWYADNTFSQIIGTSQNLLLNPPPAIGAVIPVVVTPFPTFGCVDTLYATISTSAKPISAAGADRIVCSKEKVQLGGVNASDDYLYTWTPASIINNPTLANPVVQANLLVPTEFVVKTTNKVTSCASEDTVVITPIVVDTSSIITGKIAYCPSEKLNTQLSALNPSATVQWKISNANIPGANSSILQPSTTGVYWAELKQDGCTDSTRQHIIERLEVPRVNFTSNRFTQCLKDPVEFVNTTTYSDNSAIVYNWLFPDGSTVNSMNTTKALTAIGNNVVKLYATTTQGCSDSMQKNLYVMQDCGVLMPSAFTPNRDGLNDVIKPTLSGVKAIKKFVVYNRFGQIVFSTSKENEGWDGSYKGVSLDTAVFVWVVEYITNDDILQTQKGTFTLIK